MKSLWIQRLQAPARVVKAKNDLVTLNFHLSLKRASVGDSFAVSDAARGQRETRPCWLFL